MTNKRRRERERERGEREKREESEVRNSPVRDNCCGKYKIGPSDWGTIPGFELCGVGRQQSPIDISGAQVNLAFQVSVVYLFFFPLGKERERAFVPPPPLPSPLLFSPRTTTSMEQNVWTLAFKKINKQQKPEMQG